MPVSKFSSKESGAEAILAKLLQSARETRLLLNQLAIIPTSKLPLQAADDFEEAANELLNLAETVRLHGDDRFDEDESVPTQSSNDV